MANGENHSKLDELISGGYEDTGRKYKILTGDNRGKEFQVFAQRGDIAALVYNNEADRIELVYKLAMPYTGKPSSASRLLKEMKKTSIQ